MSNAAISTILEFRIAVSSELSRFNVVDVLIVTCPSGDGSLALDYAVSMEARELAPQVVGAMIDDQLRSRFSAHHMIKTVR